jgi:cyclopropane-fatty-acyl-phospholipid synthase
VTQGLERSGVQSAAAARAARVLRQVFDRMPGQFAFRLWDGTTVTVGQGTGASAFTVVVRSPAIFARLMRHPTPYAFAEAYVDGALDIEGDLFAAMHVSEALESLRLPLAERVRLAWGLRSALTPARHARAVRAPARDHERGAT